jgi:hypothetical protein
MKIFENLYLKGFSLTKDGGVVILDIGWILTTSLIFLIIGFLTIKFLKDKRKQAYILIGIISTISIIVFVFLSQRLGSLNISSMIHFLLAILIGNGLGILLNKAPKKLSKTKPQ